MKVFVTGARGMLGVDVCTVLAARGHEVAGYGSADLDIGDGSAVRRAIEERRPDTVVNCAAYTDVDGCEADPDRAYRVNAVGAANLASACARIGCELISVSTDFVFDGAKRSGPYTEFDPIAPLGVYGRSKAAGEAMIRSVCPKHKIVRTAWLYGASGKCFPKTILRAARSRPEIRVVADQIGSPTYAADLAEAIAELAVMPLFGTYHLAGSGQCTWYELAVEIVRLAALTNVAVVPIRSDEWPTPTDRPKYSVLRSYVWEMCGRSPLRPWTDALPAFLQSLPDEP